MKELTGQGEVVLAANAHLLQPLLAHARNTPSRPLLAYRSGDGFASLSAAEVERTVRRLARGLLALGIEPGQRVALMARTRVEWPQLDFAILMAGAITVPIYPTSSADQVEWILHDSGAVAAFFEEARMHGLFQSVAERVPHCRHTFVIDEGALERLMQLGDTVEEARLEERLGSLRTDALATIIYTSGTTGRPKGCMLTHGNLRANVLQVLQAAGDMIRDEDRTLLFLPLAHSLAKIIFLVAFERGVEVAFSISFSRLHEELQKVRPDWVVAVPHFFEKIFHTAQHQAVQAGKERPFSLAVAAAVRTSLERTTGRPSLRTRAVHAVFNRLVYRRLREAFGGRMRFAVSGGGPLGERLTHFFNGIGVEVLEGYGLTETSPVLTTNLERAWHIGTVGRPVASTSLRIADDGEVLVRGPQVFKGYWQNEEATRATFTEDGWLRTGDLGTLDEAGFLRITGRKKELLVTSGGKNVAPAPLEESIRTHPMVSQAVVVGDGKPFVAAMVTLDSDALGDWARAHGKAAQPREQLVDDPELREEIGHAIEAANRSVSRAESIRAFTILPRDLSQEDAELTPTLKVRRAIVNQHFAPVISALYERQAGR